MSKPTIIQMGSLAGSPGAHEALQAHYQVIELWRAQDRSATLAQNEHVEVIVTSALHGCSAEVIERLPNLKLICSWGVGYDTIDLQACQRRNITVTNTPDVLSDCVADHAWGLLIACARHIAEGDQFVRQGLWQSRAEPLTLGTRVSGKNLGIVGLGRIGLAIAKRGSGFDMQIAYHNRRPRNDVPYTYQPDLTELARWSDFLMIATVGGSETRHLISREVLKALGPNAIVVNIARGAVIDERAMADLLQSGELGGAGLDVFENEPQVPESLKQSRRTVLMPHVGSATLETRQAMFDLVLRNLQAYFSSKALLTPIATS
jgi:lactate dehydrogenase-like 2-hydroxyacid dehydrogenase